MLNVKVGDKVTLITQGEKVNTSIVKSIGEAISINPSKNATPGTRCLFDKSGWGKGSMIGTRIQPFEEGDEEAVAETRRKVEEAREAKIQAENDRVRRSEEVRTQAIQACWDLNFDNFIHRKVIPMATGAIEVMDLITEEGRFQGLVFMVVEESEMNWKFGRTPEEPEFISKFVVSGSIQGGRFHSNMSAVSNVTSYDRTEAVKEFIYRAYRG